MFPLSIVSYAFFVTTYVCFVQGQSQCITPNGAMGQCIVIQNCPVLMDLVRKRNTTQEDIDLLKRSHCGFEARQPKVCCPQNEFGSTLDRRCFTPDAKEGTCISLFSCPAILDMLQPPIQKETLDFVRDSRCKSPDNYTVCCGKDVSEEDVGFAPSEKICEPSAEPPDPRSGCCGWEASSGNKIIGGEVASIDEFPWLVIIEYKTKKTHKLLCGGALISSRYVLTAGHCVAGQINRVGVPQNVYLGEYNITNNGIDCVPAEGGGKDCNIGAVIIPVEEAIPHPDYNPDSPLRRNDIALLRLAQSAPYNDFIKPICLPKTDITARNNDLRLVTAGWGAVSAIQPSSDVKLFVELPYVNLTECQRPYDVGRRKIQLWNGQICAGGVKGKDSCRGDSGGPLMRQSTSSMFEVVGVVSFGPSPCGLENVPGVYTKVYEYLPWIRSNIHP